VRASAPQPAVPSAHRRAGRVAAGRATTTLRGAWVLACILSATAIAQVPTPAPLAPASTLRLDELVVSATRTPEPPERVAATARVLDAATLEATPTVTLDSALRSVPSFGLFRRSDSLTANPTTQGVSLRGLGPSGASRSLVLLDGVPLNDPFGGWVNWSQLPRSAITRIEIVPGGGATAWGNSALGGVLQVFLRPATLRQDSRLAPGSGGGGAQADATFGAFGTRSATVIVNQPVGRNGAVEVMGEDFATEGFPIIAAGQRGAVDVAAWSRHRSWSAQWREALGATTEVSATVRGFEEFRGNGTAYQRNGTRSRTATLQAVAQPADNFTWTAAAYAQDQSYASTFSSINAARSAETPASDQFAVPAVALGAAWTGTWRVGAATASFGLDGRTVHGETRENYSYVNGEYTRQRVAGGTQAIGGVFAVYEQPVTTSLRLTGGLRGDEWFDGNGHRSEIVRATSAVGRDDHYADRHGAELSPSLGAVWTPTPDWRLHVGAQHGFRRPTLNELYRPFRQGPNVVEANAALRTESVDSGEIGAEWSLGRATAHRSADDSPTFAAPRALTFGVTAFSSTLHDAVTNVTVAHGPGTFPLFGTLPAGGVGRQRLNVDRVRVQGAELTAVWSPAPTLSVTAALLYTDAVVRAAAVAPALVGKQLPEVPRHTVTLGATYRAPGGLIVTPRLRWIGRQFDDDENTLTLGEVVVYDLGVTRRLGPHVDLFLEAENLGNARVETARSADGTISTGTPRLILGGVRTRW